MCGAKSVERVAEGVYWCRVSYGGCDRPTVPMEIESKEERVKTFTFENPEALADGHGATDVGNARRLIEAWGNEFQYVPGWGFVTWDGYRWRRDQYGAVHRYAKDTVRRMINDAGGLLKMFKTDREHQDDVKAAKKLLKWAEQSSNDRRINAMIKVAESEAEVVVPLEDFDARHTLFNADNATIDLTTGEAKLPERADHLTKHTKVRYDEKAECPLWQKFILEIMNGDVELADYLQRVVGYCLTGSTIEQVFWVFYGTGSNGKSTFLSIIGQLIGDYSSKTDSNTFRQSKYGSKETELARLQGSRFVWCTEVGENSRLDEEFVKSVTGQEKLRARELYQKGYDYTPEFKLVLATNHKPEIRGQDHGMWRRIVLVPFEVKFEGDRKDRKLHDKLQAELSGILNWAIAGAVRWHKDGLQTPDKATAATNTYREESDVLGEFLGENCLLEKGEEISSAVLMRVYGQFCKENNEKPMSTQAFGRRLTDRGISRRKGSDGRVILEGIGLTRNGISRQELANGGTLSRFTTD